jgi:hypothetical protein
MDCENKVLEKESKVKSKVNLSECFIKYHVIKMYEGEGGGDIAPRILNFGTRWR